MGVDAVLRDSRATSAATEQRRSTGKLTKRTKARRCLMSVAATLYDCFVCECFDSTPAFAHVVIIRPIAVLPG